MSEDSEQVRRELEKYRERIQDRTANIEQRLGTWLLVGNAAALLLCFSALLDQKICDWTSLRLVVAAFGGGVIAAFSAQLAGAYFIQIYQSLFESTRLKSLERKEVAQKLQGARGAHSADDAAVRHLVSDILEIDNAVSKNISAMNKWRTLQFAGLFLFGVSAATLVGASSYAIFGLDYTKALCAKAD